MKNSGRKGNPFVNEVIYLQKVTCFAKVSNTKKTVNKVLDEIQGV